MTQQEVIKTFMQSLDDTKFSGRAAVDEAVKASSSFGSYQEVADKFIADMKAASNWHTFLVEKCGIILDNEDTGAISGADCGGNKVKGKNDILPSKGKAKYPEGTSFTVSGLTIYGIPDKSELTDTQQYIVQGLYSWWIRDSLKLIKNSYGLTFTDENTTNARMKLKFVDDENENFLAYVGMESPSGDGKTYESRVLCVNTAHFKNMKSSNRHGSTNEMALDRTLVHELVHGVMASNINYFEDLPIFLIEGGTAELIHGVDDERRKNIIAYAKDPEVFEKLLNIGSFNSDGIDSYYWYAGGYMFMRYFAKQAADTTFEYDTYRKNISVDGFDVNYFNTVTMTGSSSSDTISNSGENVSINSDAGSDEIYNYSGAVTINGGRGHDTIDNTGANVNIFGGTGQDSIENFGEKSLIYGDVGKDYIENNISGYETISATNVTEVKKGVQNGDDTVVVIASANSTIKAYTVNLIGGNKSTIYGGAGNDSIVNNASQAVIYGDDGADYIENYGSNSKIYGGEGNDVIYNVDGQIILSDNSSINVSGKNSTIYAGDGADSILNHSNGVKIYGQSGKDTIENYGVNVSIYGGADNDYVNNGAYGLYVSFGSGDDLFNNVADSVKAYGDDGADYFSNNGEYSILDGGNDNDSFINYADYVSINGGADSDTIYSSGKSVVIGADSGNDYITNEGDLAKIDGGAGADVIYNAGDHSTITGGKGNDSITNTGKHTIYQFSKTGGSDTVFGANNNDTLQISSGSYSTVKSGDNFIVNVGSSSITFIDFGESNLIISGKNSSANLSEIVENNLIGEFEMIQPEKISADKNNLITYAE